MNEDIYCYYHRHARLEIIQRHGQTYAVCPECRRIMTEGIRSELNRANHGNHLSSDDLVHKLINRAGLQLARFPGACDHWEVCDPRWPGMIAIRLEQLGQYYVPVDGERFLEWLSATPDLTWQHVVNMLAKKRKPLKQRNTQ